jgi:hypothetical protein
VSPREICWFKVFSKCFEKDTTDLYLNVVVLEISRKNLSKNSKLEILKKQDPPIFYTVFDFISLISYKIALQIASNKMASKCVDVENDDDDDHLEDDEAEDKEEGDSVRTASTTVASLWTSHQTHRRLLQKHFLVNR